MRRSIEELGIRTIEIPCGPYSYGRKTIGDHIRFASDFRRAVPVLTREAAEQRFDLVYVNGPRVLAAASQCGLPLLFHAHSRLSRRVDLWVMRKSLRGAGVIAASAFAAEPLTAFSAPRVIPNGTPDLGYVERRFDDRPVVGVAGRIAPEKGQAEFVEAVRLLDRRGVKCSFAIRGEARFAEPDYAAAVRRSSAGLPIEFLAWQATPKEALAGIDVLVVPSMQNDAMPRIILEAFSAGIPVVAFASGGIPELIEEGKTGFLVYRRSSQALADKLQHLLATPALLAHAASRARRNWERDYTIDRFRNQVLAEFERVVLRSRTQNRNAASTASSPAEPRTGG